MGKRSGQVGCWIIMLLCCRTAFAGEGRYAAQLQAECRRLVGDAIDRPYGLAWGVAPPANSSGAQPVTMTPEHTPAAGVVVLWAGQFLKDQSLIDSAKRAAAGVASAQATDGQIAPLALFADAPTPKPLEGSLPDRAATRAGLAMMLAVADTQLARDPALVDSIDKAARWLRKSQSANNGQWVRAEGEADSERCIRLDDNDFRDSTFAMLLEFEVLQNPDARQSVERSQNAISTLQLAGMSEFLPGARLWGARYTRSGEPAALGNVPRDQADLLATRYMLQTLLGLYVTWGDRSTGATLERSLKRLEQVKRPDGLWDRYVGMAAPVASWPTGEFGLPPVVQSMKSAKSLGAERYKQLMSQGLTPKQHLAAAVVGLTDQPFNLDWPVAASETPAYIEKRSADWKILDGDVPQTLPERVQRLWVLLQRAKLEAQEKVGTR